MDRLFMNLSNSNKSGIYFIIKNRKIIYIGKTSHYVERIMQHKNQAMDWDKIKFIEYPEDRLDEMERVWINYFKPALNRTHKHGKKFKSKIEVISRPFKMKFRKLTEKSYFDFGPNRDLTVGKYLKMNKKLDLAKMYYNLSHITFFDNRPIEC